MNLNFHKSGSGVQEMCTFRRHSPLAYMLAWRADGGGPSIGAFDTGLERTHTVTEEHIAQAQTIQDYYLDRLVYRKLTASGNSTRHTQKQGFQDKLGQVLRDNQKNRVAYEYVPILYRLRDFYEQDTALDALAEQYVSATQYEVPGLVSGNLVNLRHAGTVTVTNRRQKAQYLYFVNSDRELVRIRATLDNSLLPLTNLLLSAKSISLMGQTRCVRLGRDHPDFFVQNFTDNRWIITEIIQNEDTI